MTTRTSSDREIDHLRREDEHNRQARHRRRGLDHFPLRPSHTQCYGCDRPYPAATDTGASMKPSGMCTGQGYRAPRSYCKAFALSRMFLISSPVAVRVARIVGVIRIVCRIVKKPLPFMQSTKTIGHL